MSRRVRGTRDNGVAGEERGSSPAYDLEVNHVVEPGAAGGLTELFTTGPLFTVVRRGYDQLAVDAYVDATEEELRILRRRLHAAVVRHRAAADALVEALAGPGPVVLELTGLTSLSSSGLGLLLEVTRAGPGRTAPRTVLPGSGPVRRLLDMTGVGAALSADDAPDART